MGGFYFALKNHYFCDGKKGNETRLKERLAKSVPEYPESSKYTLESSCGGIDGTPSASIKFITNDDSNEVLDFYQAYIERKGGKFTRSEISLESDGFYVSYYTRVDRNPYVWWDITLEF